ncbi:MAG TPA: hypothetical protein VN939_20615 [Chthoniobacterales bacterium]|nr:hypothetical protein [Chthoniobacterales bacterium]
MGSQQMTHNAGFYVALGVEALAIFVLLGLVIVGIIIAVRAKTGTGKGCGIVMAVAFALQSCLVGCWFLFSIVASLPSSSLNRVGQTQVIQANDSSCEISVPASWLNSPDLSKQAVLGAKDLTENEYVIVFVHPKQDYTGSLTDFAKDHTDLLRENLTTPQVEVPAAITINGRSAIRQIVHGEINRMRIAYVITYFEGTNQFYRVLCWSLESKADAYKDEFDKIAESFQEMKSNQ